MGKSEGPFSTDAPVVLPNKLGITDPDLLTKIAAEKASLRLLELSENPIDGKFDAEHLRKVHGYIYQDVYPWAGEFRTVWTSRSESFGFAIVSQIEPELARISTELKQEGYLKGVDGAKFVDRAAYYWAEWNAVHPHLDGNGRACRETLRTLALQAGYKLNWSGLRKGEVSQASSLSWSRGDTSLLANIIRERLTPLPENERGPQIIPVHRESARHDHGNK